MDKIKEMVQQFLAEEDGATMIEYGLLAALVALVVAAAVASVSAALNSKLGEVEGCIDGTNTNCDAQTTAPGTP